MKKKRVLTLFTLTMINIAAIGSVKNWPLIAEYGLSSVSYLLLAALIFFLPLALVTAELATTWPENGGIFVWVQKAFGHRTGFLAIWLFWLLNVIWYPTLLSFIAAAIAYLFDPALASKQAFTLPVLLICFWIATGANLLGIKISGWISTLGAICGTFLPGLLIILFGWIWLTSDHPTQITFDLKGLIPNFSSINEVVFFVGVLLSLCGIEMSAIHAQDVQQPKKNYPKAILLSGMVIIGLSIFGVLSIALVVPQAQLSLVSGALQALSYFVHTDHISWFLPLMAFCMLAGAFGSLSSWIAASSRGLLAAAKGGDLPPYFRRLNSKGMPARLLIIQAVLTSALSLVFAWMPTISSAFWILSALLTQLYLIIYVLVFAAAIKLRYSEPTLIRPYRVPGGKPGIWFFSLLGIASSCFAIFIGFFPPTPFQHMGNPLIYTATLLISIVLSCLAPSLILLFQKPDWKD